MWCGTFNLILTSDFSEAAFAFLLNLLFFSFFFFSNTQKKKKPNHNKKDLKLVSSTFKIYVYSTKLLYWDAIEESSGFLNALNNMPTAMTAIIHCLHLLYYCLYKTDHRNHIHFFSLCDSLPDNFKAEKYGVLLILNSKYRIVKNLAWVWNQSSWTVLGVPLYFRECSLAQRSHCPAPPNTLPV